MTSTPSMRSGRDTLVLGIETSCDETAAALVMGGGDVVSSVVSSQIELHVPFGGVVPEIASRAHLDLLNPVIARAIVEAGVDERRIDAVACTDRARPDRRPARRRVGGQGAGAGVGRPVRRRQPPRGPPLRGAARRPDDRAADRRAARLGRAHDARRDARARAATGCSARRSTTPPARRSTRSPGSSGSATRAARRSSGSPPSGDPEAIDFPRAMRNEGLDFSFSGLKTSVMNHVRAHPDVDTADVAASFQAAVVDVLVHKARRAAAEVGAKGLALGGGVAANSQAARGAARRLRRRRAARLPARAGRCAPTTRR